MLGTLHHLPNGWYPILNLIPTFFLVKKLDTWQFFFEKYFVQTIYIYTYEYLFIYKVACEYLFQRIIHKQNMWNIYRVREKFTMLQEIIYSLACDHLFIIYLACE